MNETYVKGQQVHILLSHNERRRGADPFREGTVTRVGRKYVYVTRNGWNGRDAQFDMAGCEVTSYPGNASRIMTDAQRADWDRARDTEQRFRDLGLSGVHFEIARKYPEAVVEAVLGVLEASQTEEG